MSSEDVLPTQVVVDASVGVKWLIPETNTKEASLLMSAHFIRHVPTIYYTEISQIIWKKVHVKKEMTPEDGREVFLRLRQLPLMIHPVEPLFDLTFDIAIQTGRSVYDSVYLALASSKRWRFVTADSKLLNALKNTDFERLLIWVADLPSIVPQT